MFEPYTEKARRTIFFARYEASRFGSDHIETDHLLLGLLRDDKYLFRHLLPELNYESVENEHLKEPAVVREPIPTSVDLPLSEESKRVLRYTLFFSDYFERRNRPLPCC